MKVIEQSFEILPERDDKVKQVAERARICYKSEHKAKGDESSFVKGIIEHGHNSCLEMAVVTLRIHVNGLPPHVAIELGESNYIEIDEKDFYYYVTGSVRAFREFNSTLLNSALKFYLPGILFDDLKNNLHKNSWHINDRDYFFVLDHYIENNIFGLKLPDSLVKRHHHVAVKFITNRAVTHEIVRHRPCSFLQESMRYCRYDKEQFGGEVTFIKPLFFEEGSSNFLRWEKAMQEAERFYLEMLNDGASPQAARNVLPNSCKTEIIVYASLRQWEHIAALRDSSKADPAMREAIAPVVERLKELYPEFKPQVSVG